MRTFAAAAIVLLVAGCASDPETATLEQVPAPCRTNVLFQDLNGTAALEAIAQNKPVQFEGCLADSCFVTNIDKWEIVDGVYVAKIQDAQRAEWQVRVTSSKQSKMWVTVSINERPTTGTTALTTRIGLVDRNENGLHLSEKAERKLVADDVSTLSNCN